MGYTPLDTSPVKSRAELAARLAAFLATLKPQLGEKPTFAFRRAWGWAREAAKEHCKPAFVEGWGQEPLTQEGVVLKLEKLARHLGQPAARRRRKETKERDVTPKQLEAVQVFGECKGNYAEAARRLGKDRKTVVQLCKTAMKKLGKRAVKHKRTTGDLPRDRRGQEDLAAEDDRRGI